jgi:hypothetical protein
MPNHTTSTGAHNSDRVAQVSTVIAVLVFIALCVAYVTCSGRCRGNRRVVGY